LKSSIAAEPARPVRPAGSSPTGYLYVILATLFWGGSASLARHLFVHGVPALVVVELRLLFSSLILGAYLLVFRRDQLFVPRAQWLRLVVLGLVGVAAVQGSYYTTVSLVGVGLAILLQYLAPAGVAIYEALTKKSPLTRQKGLALALTTGGTALLVLDDPAGVLDAHPFGVGLGLLSAVFFAFYMVYAKETVARVPQLTVNFYGFAIAALAWAFVNPPWKILTSGYSIGQWELFFLVAVFSVLIPFGLFYRGLARLDTWKAALTAMLEPVVAAVSAWVFLGESLGGWQCVGAGLLLVGIGWVQWEERREFLSAGLAGLGNDDQHRE
jgi:drug/metabolite transporter (DMT)-like permease